MNRRERRAATYLDSPAYIWAINNDRPQTWAKKLAYAVGMQMRSIHMEKTMGDKLTFSKMKVKVIGLTDNAVQVNIRIGDKTNTWANSVWIPRSNIRSDDDRRVGEMKQQLESAGSVSSHLYVVDWFRNQRGWTAVES